jgi:hypothetical protein
LSITHHTRKRPSTGPRTTHGPQKYYNRTAAKDGEAKKDGGDGDAVSFLVVDNVFLIFGGPTMDMSNS